MSSCFKIFEYWRDKDITKDGRVIIRPERESLRVVGDEYHPCCWACGRPVKRSEMFSDEVYARSLSEVWSDKNVNHVLQKSHIIARQFGGADVPENLFLLCEDCHADSPDTRNKATFFRWVYRRRNECVWGFNFKTITNEMKSEIEARGYELSEFARKYSSLKVELREIISGLSDSVGFHRSGVAESTFAGIVVDEIERRIIEAEKQKQSARERELLLLEQTTKEVQ